MTGANDYDAIVIGAGSAGVACATALAAGGLKRVAVIERERVGGECAFWACVPTKVLLRSESPNAQSARVPGSRAARKGNPSFPEAAAWRTAMVSGYDDAEHAKALSSAGVTLLRGNATVVGRGKVRLDGTLMRATTLVFASGSQPQIPSLEGLEHTPYWTSRDATAAGDVPTSLIILGGGAVGIELAQIFARYGSSVTILESAPAILPGEEPEAAELLAACLRQQKITIRSAVTAKAVAWKDPCVEVELANGERLQAARLCIASGRIPRTRELGFESAGITLDASGAIVIDDACCAAEGAYAIGDVTAKAMFTHVAKYQARIAAAAILGRPAKASYDAVPRCVFTSPEFAAAGMTRERAERAGVRVRAATASLSEVTRSAIYFEDEAGGAISLLVDAGRRTIVGGWIAGPQASEMIAFVCAAIRTGAAIEKLLDVILPYPTFSEAFYVVLDRLTRELESA